MNRHRRIILLNEKGWKGTRKFSLFLARNNLNVFVLIKGCPDRVVRKMITAYSKIHNFFIPQKIYSIFLFVYLLFNLPFYRIYLFISSGRTIEKGLLKLFKLQPLFIFETSNSYCIRDKKGEKIKPEVVLQKICR